MNPEQLVLIHSMTVETRAAPDRLTRCFVILIAVALVWQALRPQAFLTSAEAGRETVTVNLERIGGRYLTNGIIPVDCRGGRP